MISCVNITLVDNMGIMDEDNAEDNKGPVAGDNEWRTRSTNLHILVPSPPDTTHLYAQIYDP